MSGGENEESPSIITSLWRRVRLGAQHRLARLRQEAKLCKPKAEPRGGFAAPVRAAIGDSPEGQKGPARRLGARRSPPEGQKGPAGGPNPGPEARARALGLRPGPHMIKAIRSF